MSIISGLVSRTAILLQAGCSPLSRGETGKRVITDRTGRKWDITHTHNTYGMDPCYFNYLFNQLPTIKILGMLSLEGIGPPIIRNRNVVEQMMDRVQIEWQTKCILCKIW
jgi:hypothetical protein